ncbi:MAG: hypothetical protein UT24_C0011G0054 [Candidatus Woesebacteria bacterium GW2011_GWB1_39_12]|uniref:Uncharacterized protein n=1 Tax=Candidatus Woesebacteria bacterium GW2011_GWB1_39_12 TaxID=1618574 RepID=A0A0G0MJS3_9BACT|nr:MAG: hypothetical protein UT24_C0011G0054 [Candidatus Woesebacteria bacterium GW2011_GWB1_39_12]
MPKQFQQLDSLSLEQIETIYDQFAELCWKVMLLNTAAWETTGTGKLGYVTNLHNPLDRRFHDDNTSAKFLLPVEDQGDPFKLLMARMKHWMWLADRKVIRSPEPTDRYSENDLRKWNLMSVHLWSQGMRFSSDW